jgi:hypothetical protein
VWRVSLGRGGGALLWRLRSHDAVHDAAHAADPVVNRVGTTTEPVEKLGNPARGRGSAGGAESPVQAFFIRARAMYPFLSRKYM